jgi:hypothetical protein
MGAYAYPDFQQLDATSPGEGRTTGLSAVVSTSSVSSPAPVD